MPSGLRLSFKYFIRGLGGGSSQDKVFLEIVTTNFKKLTRAKGKSRNGSHKTAHVGYVNLRVNICFVNAC